MRLLSFCLLAGLATTANAQRYDLVACPCGPDWIVGSDRALIPQSWYGADFRGACQRHDNCLNGGCNRTGCDRQFRKDLLRSCRNSARPGQCRMIANKMSRVVRSYGGRQLTPWEKSQAIARLRQINAAYGRNPYP